MALVCPGPAAAAVTNHLTSLACTAAGEEDGKLDQNTLHKHALLIKAQGTACRLQAVMFTPVAGSAADDEDDELDEDTLRKHALLIKAAPLAGVWGLERFGLADAQVLKLLEALPGKLCL